MENGTMKIIHEVKSIPAKRRKLPRKEALEEKYPEIQKEARETGAKIMWADETCALAGEG